MRFVYYEAFYIGGVALIILALLAIRGYFFKKRLLEKFTEKGLTNELLKNFGPRMGALRQALLFAGLSLLLVAAARPQWGGEAKLVKAKGVDIIMALDISRSMLARDIKPDRFTRAKLELNELIERLRGNRMGLVIFAGTSFVQCPLTQDTGALKLFLKAVSVGGISESGTAIADALETSRKALVNREEEKKAGFRALGTKAIILLTDGEDHGEGIDEAVEKLRKEGIIVFGVGIGSPEGEPIPLLDSEGKVIGYHKDDKGETVLTKLDEEGLRKIAEATRGVYIKDTGGGVGLGAVLEAIESMETKEFETRLTKLYDEGFQYFLGAGLFLLFILALIPEQRGFRKKY